MNEHSHSHGEHDHDHEHPPLSSVDSGSQALAEALRSSFAIVKVVMAVLIVVFLASGFFKVESNERAIILRFGKPVGEGAKALLNPGLHWAFPYPIDEYQKVSVSGVQKVTSTVGWYGMTREQEIAYEATGAVPPAAGLSLNPAIDGYTLTADANIIHARATLSYRIQDPVRYTFGFINASNVVQNVLNNAIVFASANFKVDDVLTREKAGFQEAVRRRAVELLEKENLGVTVEQCDVITTWPRQAPVQMAFVAVLNAQINRDKLLQEAGSYTNQVLTAANANATNIVNLAVLQSAQFISRLASDSTNFSKLLPSYQSNADLLVQQRLNESLSRALSSGTEKWVLPASPNGNPAELRLLLNREPPKPTVKTNQ